MTIKKTFILKALLGIAVIGLVTWFVLFTDFRHFLLTTAGRRALQLLLRGWLDSAGIFGPVIFFVIFSLGCLVLLPASIFTVLGSLVYGKYLSIPMNIAGALFGAATAFIGSRYMFRETAEHFVGHRLEKWNDRMEKNGIWVVMWIRLCFVPFPVVNLGSALTKIKFRDFMLGTFFSILLPTAYMSYALGSVSELALEQRSWLDFLRQDFWIIVIGALFYLSLPTVFKKITKFKE